MDELFPTLPAASKPAAVVPKKRGDEGPGRGSGGSYAIQQGRRKKGGGLSSSQRKKQAKDKIDKLIAAVESMLAYTSSWGWDIHSSG